MPGIPGDATPAKGPADRKALIEYIEATQGFQETDWLEWKSGYDLTTPTGRASTARHIIGFANRPPELAARHGNGYSYLALGVEPGTFHGIPIHDSADIENWLRPYVGDKVVFDVDYVSAGGKDILLFTVDPPQWGDDIHSLRKESQDEHGKTMRRGTIYVRKNGKTETANDSDVEALTERARRQGTELSLDVEVAGPVTALPPQVFTDEFRDRHIARRSAALLSQLPGEADPYRGFVAPVGERRSSREFQSAVENFVNRATKYWGLYALVQAIEVNEPLVGFKVVNNTEENFEQVAVEVSIPLPRVYVHMSAAATRRDLNPPEEPTDWGSGYLDLLSDVEREVVSIHAPDIEELDSQHTLVRFSPVHARPRSRHDLGEIVIAVPPKLAGKPLKLEWRATSTSTRGDLPGQVELDVKPADPPADE